MIKEKLRRAAATAYKTWTLHHLYPGRYRALAGKAPVKQNKIVFLEVRMEVLSDSFTSVYEALQAQGRWELKPVFLLQDMADRRTVRSRCLAAIEELADAAWIFVNDSCYLLGCLPLRPETRVIQLWHACGAFKRFGYSLKGKIFGSQKKDLDRFPLYRNFHYVTVSSPEVRWAYQEAFELPRERIIPTGVARTDIFFDEQARERALAALHACFPAAAGKKVILYAPTFRGRVAAAAAPDRLDIEKLAQALGEEYVLVIKHHPMVKSLPPVPAAWEGRFARDVTQRMAIEDLLMVSDICISDYSSLIFEFSLFERPMLFFAYDLEEYFDWRGFYYPYEEMTPGPVCRTNEEMIAWLRDVGTNFDREQAAAFRARFMAACDGQATARILALLEETPGCMAGANSERIML